MSYEVRPQMYQLNPSNINRNSFTVGSDNTEDLEQEEFEAYPEEYAAPEEFEDVDGINWSLSDIEDDGHAIGHDTDML